MNFKEFLKEGFLSDQASPDVAKVLSKKLNAVCYYDESLRQENAGKNILTVKTRHGEVIAYWKESAPANGKKVYKYNFDWVM